MRRKILLSAGILVLLGFMEAAGAQDALLGKARSLFKPIPITSPIWKKNLLNRDKIELGKMLFFDPRLSASGLISCSTCHNLALGGVDVQETSTGHAWQKGPRNAPTVLNAVFNVAQFWDGRAKDLAEQATGPVQAGVEMNNTPDGVLATLNSLPRYVKLFREAFPRERHPVTFPNVGKAIEAFEATLLTPNGRFDQYLKGNVKALTAEEKEGLRLFINKGCVSCHFGVNVGGAFYRPFGVVEKPGANILPPGDKGRFAVTKTASDEFVFKVPSLRNIELTAPYFHSGSVWRLADAVDIMGDVQLGAELSDKEVDKITAFLLTLTGKQPKVEFPILPPNTDHTPRPRLGWGEVGTGVEEMP